jgi:hypothetical protein
LVALGAASEVLVRLERRAVLDERGGMLVEDLLTYSGAAAAIWRDVFASIPPAMRTVAFEDVLERAGGACSIESLEVEHLDELERDFAVRVKLRVRGPLRGELPAFDVAAMAMPRLSRRRLPFRLRAPLALEHRIELHAAPGSAFALAMPVADESKTPYASWSVERRASGEKVTLTGRVDVPAGTYAPERYQECRDAILRALDSMRVPFDLESGALRKSA